MLLRPDNCQDGCQRPVCVLVLHNQLGIFKSLQGSLRLGALLYIHVPARYIHTCTSNRDEVLFRRFGSRHPLWFCLVLGDIHALAQG